jgi:hypothetical protein
MASPIRAALAGVLLFVIGLAIGIGALENYRRDRDLLVGWSRADGEVMQVLSSSSGARPVVGFAAADGTRIRFTALTPRGSSYQVGQRVTVVYPPDDPSAARVDSAFVRLARPVFAGAGAIVLMALGGFVAFYARRRAGFGALR